MTAYRRKIIAVTIGLVRAAGPAVTNLGPTLAAGARSTFDGEENVDQSRPGHASGCWPRVPRPDEQCHPALNVYTNVEDHSGNRVANKMSNKIAPDRDDTPPGQH